MGRPKGARNKLIFKKDLIYLQERCQEIIEQVLESGSQKEKIQVLVDILPYVFQKRPLAVEHSGNLTVRNVQVEIVRTPEEQENIERYLEHAEN